MSHTARQSERDTLQQFIDDQMDDLMDKTEMAKMDFIVDLVWAGKIDVDDLIQYCDLEVREYFIKQWRPR